MNIVAFAVKDGVISSANDGVQVAGRSAMRAGIALARDTNALPIARTCFDTHLERFSLLHGTFTVAGAAGCYVLAGAVATCTGRIELHASTGLRDLASAAAIGTSAR